MSQPPTQPQRLSLLFPGSGTPLDLDGPAGTHFHVEGLRYAAPDEVELLPLLPRATGRFLLPGTGGSPLVPAALAALNPTSRVDVSVLDLHEARLLQAKLAGFANLAVTCEPDPLSAPAEPQTGILLVGNSTDRLLVYDLIERLDAILPGRSRVLVQVPRKRWDDLAGKVARHLRPGRVRLKTRNGVVYQGLTGGEPTAWSPRLCEFVATTQYERVQLCSRPGVFSHGRPDPGGLALAEIVEVSPGTRLLDLGCGCGLTGLLLAQRLCCGPTPPDSSVVLVDSNARAIACARIGIERNALRFVETRHTDRFEPPPGSFDLVVANPPYYAGHRICEQFLGTAAQALRPGGRLGLVSKHGQQVQALAQARGFLVETRSRRGYDITLATRLWTAPVPRTGC